MKRRGFLIGLSATALAPGASGQSILALEGTWSGLLGGQMRLRLNISADGSVALYSLDQGAAPIGGLAKRLKPEKVLLQFPSVKGRFEGRFVDGALDGVWTQGGKTPLRLVRGAENFAASAPAAFDLAGLAKLRAASGSPAMIAMAQRAGAAPIGFVQGVRQIDRSEPATLEDRWHLGSITKSMTATLVARLVEADAVRWEDTPAILIPDAAKGSPLADVTFSHLLSHHAGLQPNVTPQQFAVFPRENPDPRTDRLKWSKQALAQAPVSKPGGAPVYSNSGFIIAAAMLEAKLGRPWETLISEQVFQPLGLSSAGFGPPGRKGAVDEPVGHALSADTQRLTPHPPGDGVADNPAVVGPAGRVHMRFADLLAYLAAHRDRTAFLKPESWAKLQTPPFGGNGAMGWQVRPDGALWHNGSNTFWYAEALVDAKTGIIAAAAANDGTLEKSPPAVAAALAGIAASV